MRNYIVVLLLGLFLYSSCSNLDNSDPELIVDDVAIENEKLRAFGKESSYVISNLIEKLPIASLPQKISSKDKLAECPLSKPEVAMVFNFFWPKEVDTKYASFLNVQKYVVKEDYTFIGVEFQAYDAGTIHSVNFCTFETETGKIISQADGLILAEGATDYTDGRIEISASGTSILLKMIEVLNDSGEEDVFVYELDDKGLFSEN